MRRRSYKGLARTGDAVAEKYWLTLTAKRVNSTPPNLRNPFGVLSFDVTSTDLDQEGPRKVVSNVPQYIDTEYLSIESQIRETPVTYVIAHLFVQAAA
jgi:hypothetical protein